MNKMSKLTDDELKDILNSSRSMREAILKIGYKSAVSGSYTTVKNECKKRNITIPKYNYFGDFQFDNRKENYEIFIENSTCPRNTIKNRIISENLIEHQCSNCGNKGIWMGNLLSLQLEHKNGINNDNRLENLCFLCQNCHSQTDTFSGKSRKKRYYCECGTEIVKTSNKCNKCSSKENGLKQRRVERPTKEILIKEVQDLGYAGTGRKYGVSDNAIKKWLK